MNPAASTPPTTATGRPGFTLDLARCVGCGACVVGCRTENRLPAGVSWRRVLQVNRPRIGGGPTFHLSVACHHCQNPPCVKACPSGALDKTDTGLVLLESDRCIGCRYCEMACPFGAPSFDVQAGIMTKCHLCHHRLAESISPACVAACPTKALEFTHSEKKGGFGEKTYVSAPDVPGFGDPGGAGPGFWAAGPGGKIRSQWFLELKALLGLKEGEPHDPA